MYISVDVWVLYHLRVRALIQLGTHGQTTGSGVVGQFSPLSLGYLSTLMAGLSNLPFADGGGDTSSWCPVFDLFVIRHKQGAGYGIVGIPYLIPQYHYEFLDTIFVFGSFESS